jgi:hypothetical protein
MLLVHPRFLARLFASISSKKTDKVDKNDYVFSMANAQGGSQTKREIGGGGLFQGWILRKGRSRVQIVTHTIDEKDPFATPFDDPSPSPAVRATLYPPPHITPLHHNLPLSSTLFLAPFSRLPNALGSSITLARIYIVLGYLAFVIIALVWKCDLSPTTKTKGYGADFLRPGLVATAQIPVIVALGVRGNLLGLCVGVGYERIKVFHKVVGRTVFLCSTLHIALYGRLFGFVALDADQAVHKWVQAGTFRTMITKPFAICGMTTYCSILLIAISSLPWIRKACYGIFEVSQARERD